MTTAHDYGNNLVKTIRDESGLTSSQMGDVLLSGGILGHIGLEQLLAIVPVSKHSSDVILSLTKFAQCIPNLKMKEQHLIAIGCEKKEYKEIQDATFYFNVSLSTKLESKEASILFKYVNLVNRSQAYSCVAFLSKCSAPHIFIMVSSSDKTATEKLTELMEARGQPLYFVADKDDFRKKVNLILTTLLPLRGFDKMIDKPAIYDDLQVLAYHHSFPQTPTHFLVITNRLISTLEEANEDDGALLGKLLLTAAKVARGLGVTDGYRIILNNGKDAGQTVLRIHLHVLAGSQLDWIPSELIVRRKKSEVDKVQSAVRTEETIFDKIINKQIPAKIIYDDDEVLAFHDVSPQAQMHFLVIPKRRIVMLEEANEDDGALLGKLLLTAAKVARELGVTDGYRVVVNNGKNGCQSVFHLHLHILAGRQL